MAAPAVLVDTNRGCKFAVIDDAKVGLNHPGMALDYK
jgi:hypothetical protein